MNLTKNPTIEELKKLLICLDDDSSNHIVWVSYDGEVHINPVEIMGKFINEVKDELKFRIEIYIRGNKYVGNEAANDPKFLNRLFNGLIKFWETNRIGFVDDPF